jgi:hypothetical protein
MKKRNNRIILICIGLNFFYFKRTNSSIKKDSKTEIFKIENVKLRWTGAARSKKK